MATAKDRGLTRDFRIDRSKVDAKTRTVELAFSSEEPVQRWGENEVLSHAEGDYDFSRLNADHPLLLGHDESDPRSQIGVIEKARVDGDKVGRAVVRFSKSPLGDEIFNDVQDGIRKLISVGYDRTALVSRQQADGVTTAKYKWMPTHIAIVPVPADTAVGVGRQKPVQHRNHQFMNNQIDPASEIRERTAVLRRDFPNLQTELNELLGRAHSEGWGLDKWTQAWRALAGQKPITNPISLASLGCNEREAGSYSFARAIQSCVKRNSQTPDGFEGEIHQEITKHNLGFTPAGFLVPSDAKISARSLSRADRQRMARDLQVNVFAQGGATVATEVATPIVEILRNRMWSDRLGVRILSGLEGNVVIPRQTAAGTAYSVSEIAALTLSNQDLDQIAVSPKRVGATGQYSKQLILQSSIDVESFMRDDFLKVIAISWDRLILNGAGAGDEPLGIMQTPGIGSVILGGAASWTNLVAFETAVAAASADTGPAGYVTSPTVRGKLKTAAKLLTGATTVAAVPLWDNGTDDGEPWIGSIAGYPAVATNQMPNNQMLYGVFSEVLHCLWGGVDIVVDPFTLAKQAEVAITVNTWGDVAIRHPQCFCLSADSAAQ